MGKRSAPFWLRSFPTLDLVPVRKHLWTLDYPSPLLYHEAMDSSNKPFVTDCPITLNLLAINEK
jgi:hypothetical protein